MAHVYIDSNAAGAGTGANWANAYTTIAAALGAKAAGDNFWVAHNHAETQASALTATSPATAASPCTVICVNSAGSVPPVSADLRTTATVTTTGANALTLAGPTTAWTYWYGISFSAGTGASAANLVIQPPGRFEACNFILGTSSASSLIQLGTATPNIQEIAWNNCTVKFGATGQSIGGNPARFIWQNTASAIDNAGTIPTGGLFQPSLSGDIMLEAVDLNNLGSNPLYAAAANRTYRYNLKDCKVGSISLPAPTGSGGIGATDVRLIRCDSGATNYRHERRNYAGSQVIETTVVRTGGASDGTTSIAWKIDTTANSELLFPFECLPIQIWNETTGSSITVTVYGIWGGGAVPNNDELWMDVEYLGSSATPQGSFASSGKADYLASASALASDSSTWGGSTTKFKMTATFTPQMKGPITIYVKAAKTSSTFYVDPKPALS